MTTIETAVPVALLPEVREFLDKSPIRMFAGGEWIASASGRTFKTVDPGTGVELAEVCEGDAPDIERAVNAAFRAFRQGGWPRLEPRDRAVLLHRLADLVEKRLPVIAQLESLDCGKILDQAKDDIRVLIGSLRYYADIAQNARLRLPIAIAGHDVHSSLEPYGPCGFIIPWNFPAVLLGWGIAPALAAGNTVVVKPAEDTPLSTVYFCRLVEEAGIPPGVVNVVPGFGETAGAALARHPGLKRMSFTGSPEVGRLVARAAGENLVPVKLELGGKGAAVLFEDIDVEDTAEKLVQAITFHTGQVCCTATRWVVHDKIYDDLVGRCAEKLARVRVGHEAANGTQMGPVVSPKQKDRVLGYLRRGRETGAKLVLEGGAAKVQGCDGGTFVKPALLAGSPDNVCCREEIFGPVAYILRFRGEDEAIDLVNRSSYGLANSVWSRDLARAGRVAEAMIAGNSWINAHNVFAPGIPYAGVNLSGMGGGVNCPQTFYDYLRPKSVVRPLE